MINKENYSIVLNIDNFNKKFNTNFKNQLEIFHTKNFHKKFNLDINSLYNSISFLDFLIKNTFSKNNDINQYSNEIIKHNFEEIFFDKELSHTKNKFTILLLKSLDDSKDKDLQIKYLNYHIKQIISEDHDFLIKENMLFFSVLNNYSLLNRENKDNILSLLTETIQNNNYYYSHQFINLFVIETYDNQKKIYNLLIDEQKDFLRNKEKNRNNEKFCACLEKLSLDINNTNEDIINNKKKSIKI